jgi:hypothetical protein
MDDKNKKDTPTIKFSEVMKLLDSQTKVERIANEEELPTVLEVLEREMRPGTVLVYQEKDVIFKDSAQSTVKNLKVNVVSTESQDMAILHRLHTLVRSL